eukprot:358013-Chlamydomonas_euryale.AAC.2
MPCRRCRGSSGLRGSIDRAALWVALTACGVLDKLVCLPKALYADNTDTFRVVVVVIYAPWAGHTCT